MRTYQLSYRSSSLQIVSLIFTIYLWHRNLPRHGIWYQLQLSSVNIIIAFEALAWYPKEYILLYCHV